ncbi:MAG: SPOR domain-containing protein [Tannerella sp.]|jgi:hypothetical protein|nr:SPOR domain-containing protein [Tannerella sp.]
MKRLIINILLFAGGLGYVSAQSPLFSIFDSFDKTPKSGEGKVVVHQSNALKKLVGTRIDSENIDVVNGKTFLVTQGYRVQVYSGNNQRTSRAEAFKLQTKIKELYQDIATYVTFNAPFWKLHVGNYRSFEEASLMLRDLRSTFPQIKNEIFIIEDDIRLPLD